jgi:hypothetical protein
MARLGLGKALPPSLLAGAEVDLCEPLRPEDVLVGTLP